MTWILCSCGKVLSTKKAGFATGHLRRYPDHHEIMRWTFGGREGYKRFIEKPLKTNQS